MTRDLERLALLLLLLCVPAAGAMGTTLPTSVIGSAGTTMTSASYKLTSTLGQPLISPTGGLLSASYLMCSGFWCSEPSFVVAVEPPAAHATLSFAAPTPNPGFEHVDLSFTLPKAASVQLAVFDVRGARVGSLVSERLDPGPYRRVWDGQAGGRRAGPGIYFAVLTVDGVTVGRRRLVLLR